MEESGNISLGSEAKRRTLCTILHNIQKLIQTRSKAAGLRCLTSCPLATEHVDPWPGQWGAPLTEGNPEQGRDGEGDGVMTHIIINTKPGAMRSQRRNPQKPTKSSLAPRYCKRLQGNKKETPLRPGSEGGKIKERKVRCTARARVHAAPPLPTPTGLSVLGAGSSPKPSPLLPTLPSSPNTPSPFSDPDPTSGSLALAEGRR